MRKNKNLEEYNRHNNQKLNTKSDIKKVNEKNKKRDIDNENMVKSINKKSLNKTIFLSLMVAVALGIYVIEAQIPVIFPGIKLGLANVVSLIVLIAFGGREAILVMFLRTLLGTMFTGTLSSFLFSITGGLLSNIVTIIMYRKFKKYFSIEVISIVGAVFHNLGQLLVAAFIVQDFRIYVYFPVLMISALITGYFIGLVAKYFSKHIDKVIGKRKH